MQKVGGHPHPELRAAMTRTQETVHPGLRKCGRRSRRLKGFAAAAPRARFRTQFTHGLAKRSCITSDQLISLVYLSPAYEGARQDRRRFR